MPLKTSFLNQKIFVHTLEASQYSAKEGWLIIDRHQGKSYELEGKRRVVLQEERSRCLPLQSCERIQKIAFALICTLASLGLALVSKTIRRCFTGYQVVKIVKEVSEHSDSSSESFLEKPPLFSSGPSHPFSGESGDRLRELSRTIGQSSPELWNHYMQALSQYSEATPAVQKKILSVYARDYEFQCNEKKSLENFRKQFGPPPLLREGLNIHVWDDVAQYALQILRERQGELSPDLMNILLAQLREFLRIFPDQFFQTFPKSKRTEKLQTDIVFRRDKAEAPLWGRSNSLITNHLGKEPVPFFIGRLNPSDHSKEIFPACTGKEFICRVWIFTQTYFDSTDPKGTQAAQNAIIEALSGAYDSSNDIACHQAKCSHITSILLHLRLNGMGHCDFEPLGSEKQAQEAVLEFFTDPQKGREYRALLDAEESLTPLIKERLLKEGRLWHKQKRINVDLGIFEIQLIEYSKRYYTETT